jgi:hypothetical protein
MERGGKSGGKPNTSIPQVNKQNFMSLAADKIPALQHRWLKVESRFDCRIQGST